MANGEPDEQGAEEAPPAPLEPAPLDFLLAEAKDRYKSEHDKFGQTYSRAGIYLGVLAVYVNLMVRFLDKPPPHYSSWVELAFRYSIGGLVVAIVGAAACIVGAILGRAFAYVPEPSSWLTFIDGELRPFILAQGGALDDGAALGEELRRQILARYAKAIDYNSGVNGKVTGWLHFASYCILAGLGLAVAGTSAYAWLAFSVPAAELKARAVDHLEIAPYTHK